MRKLLNTSIVLLAISGSIQFVNAQNPTLEKTNGQLSSVGMSFKVFCGPELFFQSNLKAPMPIVGLRGSFIFNTTELEIGVTYFPKMYQIENSDGLSYKSVFYTYHYILPTLHVHQKIFAKNKHILSASIGLELINPGRNFNFADTLMNDNSHRITYCPTSYDADRLVVQIGTSVRYTYQLTKHFGFFLFPYLNFKTGKEFVMPDPNHSFSTDTYIPPMNTVSFGLNFGCQFIVHFDKAHPPQFFSDQKAKDNTNLYYK